MVANGPQNHVKMIKDNASQDNQDDGECVAQMQQAVRLLLECIGEDVSREGLVDTPKRVAQAWLDMAANTGIKNRNGSQVKETHKEAIGNALFHEPLLISSQHDGFILVRDMTFAFLSEMTLLPTFGKCHIAYSPRNGTIVGLSKLSRVTKSVSGVLQSPQRFAAELMSVIQEEVEPIGIAVVAECNIFDSNVPCKENDGSASVGTIRKEIVLSTFGSFSSDSVSELLALLNVDSRDNNVDSVSHHPSKEPLAIEPVKAALEDPKTRSMIEAVKMLLRGIGEDPDRLDLSHSPARYIKWLRQATGGYSMPALVPGFHGYSVTRDKTDSKSLENLSSTVFYANFGPESDSGIVCAQPDVASDASSCDIITSMDETPSNHQIDAPKEIRQDQRTHHEGRDSSIQRMPSSTHSNSIQLIRVPFTSQCEHHLLPFYGSIVIARRMMVNISTNWLQRVCELVVDRFSRRLQVQERLTSQVADAIMAIFPEESFLVFCSCKHMCMVARGVEEHCSSTASMTVRGMASWITQPKARMEFLQAIRGLHVDNF
jgi:GTP cyclohydrolase I